MATPKPTDTESELQKLQTSVSFKFQPIESKLLGKISRKLFKTKAEQRIAFLLLGRWCLANWDKVEPSLISELRYAAAEGIPPHELAWSKIAQQVELFGKARPA